jgi:integrase
VPKKLDRALSTIFCNNVKKKGLYCDGGGLYLQVLPAKDSGFNKSWVFRYGRDMGLGSYPSIGLSAARTLAEEQRIIRQRGLDPITERNANKAKPVEQIISVDRVSLEYIAAHEAEWKSSTHRTQWNRTLSQYVSPIIGKMAVKDVETKHVMAVLNQPVGRDRQSMWTVKRETAARLRGRLELILDYAKITYGFAWSAQDGGNPSRWRGHLSQVLPKRSKNAVQHHKAMRYEDIGNFMVELRQKTNVAARALEFTILTAARSGEVREARWSEIAADVWTVPAQRMKAGLQHRVPLAPRCLEILEEMAKIRQSDFIFAGTIPGHPLGKGALLECLRTMRQDVDIHGMRASFKSWASAQTNFANEAIEMALAHAVGDAVEQAYQRDDLLMKRRPLMVAWSRFVATPRADATVTELRKQA